MPASRILTDDVETVSAVAHNRGARVTPDPLGATGGVGAVRGSALPTGASPHRPWPC
jgi:hypothetical protein